jgi:hypothetical protein
MTNYYKEGYIHIIFPLKQDSDSYSDSGAERLWAKRISQNQYQIENIPFYVKGLSFGDIVEAKEISEDVYEFIRIQKHSGHTTFRIFVSEDVSDKERVLQNILKDLNSLGAQTEGMEGSSLTAIDLPPTTDISKVGQYLNDKYKAGLLDYEEAAIPDNYISPPK